MGTDRLMSVGVDGNVTTITIECVFCRAAETVTIPYDGFAKWYFGEIHIQYAMPDVDAETREVLITHACRKCLDAVYATDEAEADILRNVNEPVDEDVPTAEE